MDETRKLIEAFVLRSFPFEALSPMAGDAGFRSYWRVQAQGKSYVVMDSPPHLVDMKPFIQIGNWLFEAGIPVPEIIDVDPEQRFMLLEDLGQDNLFARLQQNADIKLLQKPIDVLHDLARLPRADFLPAFSKDILVKETALFDEWCLAKHDYGVAVGELDNLYTLIADEAMNQPQCFVHRDFHSLNIHFAAGKPHSVALIDFQDGLWGPATYDLASILHDRYISWSQQQISDVIESYRQAGKISTPSQEFKKQVLWVSLQRNIRILGVFHRLSMRDSKHIYLDYLPRKAEYCLNVINQYDELKLHGKGLVEVIGKAGW